MQEYLMGKWGDYTPNQLDRMFFENFILLCFYTLVLPIYYNRVGELLKQNIELARFKY